MNRPFPLRSVEERVGALVLVTLVTVIALVGLAARVRGWFEPEVALTVVLPEEGTFGLGEGADVEVLGAVVGRVEDIDIDPETERIRATALVSGEFRTFVRGDSRVVIQRKLGLAGDAYLEIVGGTRGVAVDPRRPLVATAAPGMVEGVQAVLQEVRDAALPAVDELHALLAETRAFVEDLRDPEGQLLGLVARVDELVHRATDGGGPVGHLLADETWAAEIETALVRTNELLEGLERASASATEATDEISGTLAELRGDLPDLVADTRALVGEVQGILGDVRETTRAMPAMARTVGGEVGELPGLVGEVHDTLREVEQLVEALQRHWLIRGYVDEGPPIGRISPASVSSGGGE